MSPKPPAAPPPSLIQGRLAEIRSLAGILPDEYRWAYHASLSRSKGESVMVRTGSSDPVGDLVSDPVKQGMRRNLSKADKLIDQAYAALDAAHSLILSSMDRLDPPDVPTVMDKRRITKAEYEALVGAKARRDERGAGYGQG